MIQLLIFEFWGVKHCCPRDQPLYTKDKAVWRVYLNPELYAVGSLDATVAKCRTAVDEMLAWLGEVAGNRDQDWWVYSATRNITDIEYYFDPMLSVAFKLRFG